MSTHNIGFNEEISKIISKLSSNTHLICSGPSGNMFPRNRKNTNNVTLAHIDETRTMYQSGHPSSFISPPSLISHHCAFRG